MEPIFQAHPIPQNVTNFEFHLVGDMTLKQFAYLAAGVGFAFLIFTTLSTVQPIIAWPIIVISALLGVAFAFLPIQERPLDHWVAAFFKAIFKPTSLKFSSKIINDTDPLFNKRLNHYLKTYEYAQAKEHAILGNPNLFPTAVSSAQPVPKTAAPAPSLKKQNFIDKFKAGQTTFGIAQMPQPIPAKPTQRQTTSPVSQTQQPPAKQPSPTQPKVKTQPGPVLDSPAITMPNTQTITQLPDLSQGFKPIPLASSGTPRPVALPKTEVVVPSKENANTVKPEDLKKTVELAKKAQETQQEIVKIETSLSQIKQQAAQPGVDPKSYVEDFEDLLTELQKLNEKASDTAKELAEVSKTQPVPVTPSTQTISAAPIKAKSIPTLKLTSFPNVINSIVTDSMGNYIEGAIVVAHDKQGLPVRALKSNKLGQFVAATPLPNGEYTIVVEKDNLAFDKIGIELKNEILPPILVAAKKLQPGS